MQHGSGDDTTRTGAERAWLVRMAALGASYHRLLVQDASRRFVRIEELLQTPDSSPKQAVGTAQLPPKSGDPERDRDPASSHDGRPRAGHGAGRSTPFRRTACRANAFVENGYAWQVLLLRLLVVGLSALVVYFVIAGRLIGGALLPQASGLTGGFGCLWQDYGADGYSGPKPGFAKAIVWCFLAGFSERFLPDSLSD
jgi:hypothetical protein